MKTTATTTTLGNDMGTLTAIRTRGTLRNSLVRAFLLAVTVTCALAFATMAAAWPQDLALWEQVGTQTKLTQTGCIALIAAIVVGLASLWPLACKVDAAGKWRG